MEFESKVSHKPGTGVQPFTQHSWGYIYFKIQGFSDFERQYV